MPIVCAYSDSDRERVARSSGCGGARSRNSGVGRPLAVMRVGRVELGRAASGSGIIVVATPPILHSPNRCRKNVMRRLLERPLAARSLIASLLLRSQPPRMRGAPARAVVRAVRRGRGHGAGRAQPDGRAGRAARRPTACTSSRAGCGGRRARAGLEPRRRSCERWHGAWRMAVVDDATRGAATDRGALRDAMRRLRYARAARRRVDPTRQLAARVGADETRGTVADAQCAWWTGRPDDDPARSRVALFDRARLGDARRRGSLRDSTRVDGRARRRRGSRSPTAFVAGAAALAHIRADPLLPDRARADADAGDALRAAYRSVRSASSPTRCERGSERTDLVSRRDRHRRRRAARRRRPRCCPTSSSCGGDPPHSRARPRAAADAGTRARRARRPRPRRAHRRRRSRRSSPTSTATATGPVVLLRGDMDALPMPEDTGLEFASDDRRLRCTRAVTTRTPRCSSARRGCCTRGAASLPGTVRFMFQPGEEGFHGARYMIDEGVLDGDATSTPRSRCTSRRTCRRARSGRRGGPLMASADVLDDHRDRQGRSRVDAVPRERPDAGRGRDRAGAAGARDATHQHVRSRRRHDHEDPRRHDEQRDSRDASRWWARCAPCRSTARAQAIEAMSRSSRASRARTTCAPSCTSSPGYPVTVNDDDERVVRAAGRGRSARRRQAPGACPRR